MSPCPYPKPGNSWLSSLANTCGMLNAYGDGTHTLIQGRQDNFLSENGMLKVDIFTHMLPYPKPGNSRLSANARRMLNACGGGYTTQVARAALLLE